MKPFIRAIAALMISVLFLAARAEEPFVIPADVAVIEEEAFMGDTSITSLVVSEGVREIGARAFSGTSVSAAELPASLEFIADDAFQGLNALTVTAPEGSYALSWAQAHGFSESAPFSVSAEKDFSSFADARSMVVTEMTVDWSGTGRVRYVEQFGGARTYVPEYWTSLSDASGSCTRAASSMAVSYMGINALPKSASNVTRFHADMKALGCPQEVSSGGKADRFTAWYDEYARDESGLVSPVVIYTNHQTSTHAFVVIGRDKAEHDCFYVVDSGSSSYVNRVRLGVQNGVLVIREYLYSTQKLDTRYSEAYSVISIWRYRKTA